MGGGVSFPKRKDRQMEVLVAHYSPCWTFRSPQLNTNVKRNCSKSLEDIYRGQTEKFLADKAKQPKETLYALPHFFDIFYKELFAIEPTCRAMFEKVNLQKQGTMLFKSFRGIASISTSNTNAIMPKLKSLIDRHTFQYNVHPIYYSYFCEAMIKTLRQALGRAFTTEVEFSWVTSISHMMKLIIPLAVEGWEKKKTKPQVSREDSASSKLGSPNSWFLALRYQTSWLPSTFRLQSGRRRDTNELFDSQNKWESIIRSPAGFEENAFWEDEVKEEENGTSSFELESERTVIAHKESSRRHQPSNQAVFVNIKLKETRKHKPYEINLQSHYPEDKIIDGGTRHYGSLNFDDIEDHAKSS
mmetsp:Transcript_9958/g.13018  ORF Transcript_9958/g.13018 Transcript_9958/m.13018 type:complete len:358 (-) Transcript_9958:365-1438(-)